MKDIVLLWVQWSWKWTQAEKLLEYFWPKYKYFEAGNVLRALKLKPNALGDYVKKTIDGWNLVKDEFISNIFFAFLSTLEFGEFMLIDGYPRKEIQMMQFIERMDFINRDFQVIFLDLDEEEAVSRLSKRRLCYDCGQVYSLDEIKDQNNCKKCNGENIIQREDDTPDAVKQRLKLYKTETQAVIDYFQKNSKIDVIDAGDNSQKVFEKILEVLE